MGHSWARSFLFVALTLASTVSAQSPSTQPSTLRPNQPGMPLRLAQPISERDLDRYASLLTLSEAQRSFLAFVHSKYLDDWRALTKSRLPRVIELTHSYVTERRASGFGPVVADLYSSIVSEENALHTLCCDLDAILFGRLEAVLAEAQRERFPRVKWHRERRRCWEREKAVYSARIDLTQLIEDTRLSAEVMQAIDTISFEYERQVSPHFVQVDESIATRRDKLLHLYVEPKNDVHSRTEAQSVASELLRPGADGQERILHLNATFLPQFVSLLPPDDAQRINDTYNRLANPKVFPDRTSPEGFYREIHEHEVLTNDLKAMIDEVWNRHLKFYNAINETMQSHDTEWQIRFAREDMALGYEEYRDAMRTLREQRWQRNERTIRELKSLLPPDVAAVMNRAFQAAIDTIEHARRRAHSDSYPGS